MMSRGTYYSPYQLFVTMNGDANWGKMFYYWGTGLHSTIADQSAAPLWAEENDVKSPLVK